VILLRLSKCHLIPKSACLVLIVEQEERIPSNVTSTILFALVDKNAGAQSLGVRLPYSMIQFRQRGPVRSTPPFLIFWWAAN